MDTRDGLKRLAKSIASRSNLEIHRWDLAHPARRVAAMQARGFDLVLDVGANAGQYVSWLRASGYTGMVLSFEPIPEVYERMCSSRSGDASWRGYQAAVGAETGQLH